MSMVGDATAQVQQPVAQAGPPLPARRSRDAARTRDQIIAAARRVFSEWGYEAATVRQIAVEAGVAANLITRYFGGKAGLFRAASNIDLGVVAAVDGPYESLGARIAATVLTRYETGPTADPLQMLARSAGTPNGAGLGDYFAEQAARPLVATLTTRWGGTNNRPPTGSPPPELSSSASSCPGRPARRPLGPCRRNEPATLAQPPPAATLRRPQHPHPRPQRRLEHDKLLRRQLGGPSERAGTASAAARLHAAVALES